MCDDHDHGAELDLEAVYREFHEIKHLLTDLNKSVGEIARSLQRMEQARAGEEVR
jgi:hypothetical protein